MPNKPKTIDPIAEKLESISITLQDLLILECARAGMSKAEVRKIVGVADARVSRIWKNIKTKSDE
jgi:hypothetical protein